MYCFQQMNRYGFRGRCTKFPNIRDENAQVVPGNGYFQTESFEELNGFTGGNCQS